MLKLLEIYRNDITHRGQRDHRQARENNFLGTLLEVLRRQGVIIRIRISPYFSCIRPFPSSLLPGPRSAPHASALRRPHVRTPPDALAHVPPSHLTSRHCGQSFLDPAPCPPRPRDTVGTQPRAQRSTQHVSVPSLGAICFEHTT